MGKQKSAKKRFENNLFLGIMILITVGLGLAEAIDGRHVEAIRKDPNRNIRHKNINIAFKVSFSFTLIFYLLVVLETKK